jgi:hypothetical protein
MTHDVTDPWNAHAAENPARGLTRVARWLLWLYPRAWRARYRVEMLALLGRYPVTLWTLADLPVAAVDAHLSRRVLPQEVFTMAQRIRTGANAMLAAFALFFIAWVMVPFISGSPATWDPLVLAHPEIGYALVAFRLAGVVAALALLVGGLPLLVATIGQAPREGRRDMGWRLAIPAVLAAALIAYSWVAVPTWWTGERLRPQDLTPTATAVRISFFALTFLFIGLSAWAVASAASRGQPGAGVVRFIVIPSLILALALAAGLIALVTLTALVMTLAPQTATSADGSSYFLFAFDAITLVACLIAGGAMLRMSRPGAGEVAV